jgi:hypothetical protein
MPPPLLFRRPRVAWWLIAAWALFLCGVVVGIVWDVE